MDWAWVSSFEQIWNSPHFPIWLALAGAGFFGLVVLVTLLRAEKSVANAALTVITLLAIGTAVAATIRGFGPDSRGASTDAQSIHKVGATLPALSCIDDLAGDVVLNACEKALFGSAESAAAAVTYAATQISRLTSIGDAATAEQHASSELQALRRAVERDRYGLMAYVLMARDNCTPSACAAFGSLKDYHQITANMDERVYENLITRYAPSWNTPGSMPPPAAGGAVVALPPSLPTGKATSAEFPTSASIPPVNIMMPEPEPAPAAAAPAAKPPSTANAATVPAAPRAPAAAAPVAPSPALASAKKPAAPKRPPAAAAPVQLTPAVPASEAVAAED